MSRFLRWRLRLGLLSIVLIVRMGVRRAFSLDHRLKEAVKFIVYSVNFLGTLIEPSKRFGHLDERGMNILYPLKSSSLYRINTTTEVYPHTCKESQQRNDYAQCGPVYVETVRISVQATPFMLAHTFTINIL